MFLKNFPYDTIRPQQEQILDFVSRNMDKKYFLINAPTGVGKSALAYTLGSALGRSWVLTESKSLQDQYVEEFKTIASIKGKNSYACNLNLKETVDTGPCNFHSDTLKSCKRFNRCLYYNAFDDMLLSQIAVTNYNYILGLYETKSPELVTRNNVICDEGHVIENKLVEHVTIRIKPEFLISRYDLDLDEGMIVNDYKDNIEELLNIIKKSILTKLLELSFELSKVPKKITNGIHLEPSIKEKVINRKIHALKNHISKLDYYIMEEERSNWIIDVNEEENTLSLIPLYASKEFRTYFDTIASGKVFIMSASLGDFDALIKELGLPPELTACIDVDTPFKPDKSPVIVLPILNLGYKTYEANKNKMVEVIDDILDAHAEEKGIIHSGNYKIAQYLVNHSKHKNRFLYRESDDPDMSNSNMFDLHCVDDRPTVLLSPSMHTGIDLKGDLARFQIIPKLPYANMKEARVVAKMNIDNSWYTNQTWMKIIQACGRATRNEEDESITYILDTSITYQYNIFKKRLPKWFKKRLIFQ